MIEPADLRPGQRVHVNAGKLKGRDGTVLEYPGADQALVSEDGPDDVDDWVPLEDLDPLGEWVGPNDGVLLPCHEVAKPREG